MKRKKTAYRKDIIRAITHEKKRFFSIMIIVALGVIVLTGLRAACVDLRKTADEFFDDQMLFDISVQSTLGLTDDDVEALSALEGVDQAEGGFSETVYLTGETHESVTLKTLSPTGLNEPYVIDGSLPEAANEIAVSEGYIINSGRSIGDTVTLQEPGDSDDEDGEDSEDDGDEEGSSSIDVDIDMSSLEEEDEDTLLYTEFVITAIVTDPANINDPDGTTAFRDTSTTDYTFFVTPEAINSDVYTVVYITVLGAAELNCYGDDYDEAVSGVISDIESEIKADREGARTEEVVSEAQGKIDDAEATMNEAFEDADSQIADAQAELSDARQEMDDAWQEIYDGLQEIEDGQAEIDDYILTLQQEEENAYAQIEDARAELEDGRAQLLEALSELEENEAVVADGIAQLNEQKEALAETQAETESQINDGRAQLSASRAELESNLNELTAQAESAAEMLGELWPEEEFSALRAAAAASEDTSEAYAALTASLGAASEYMSSAIQAQIDALNAQGADDEETQAQLEVLNTQLQSVVSLPETIPQLAVGLGQIDAGLAEIEAQEELLDAQTLEAEAQFEEAWQIIYESEAELNDAWSQLQSGREQIDASQAELTEGEETLSRQEALAEEEFADAWETLYENQQELDEGLQELYDGIDELNEAEEEYEDGVSQLNDSIEEYEELKADAIEQLDDAQQEVDDIDSAVWYVQDRTSLSGYVNIDSDSGAIEAIGNVFPVIFIAVAVLISLTTITRLVEEERSLIGTYKALGFTDSEIRRKYMIYVMAACIAGSIIGEIGGFIALPEIVFIIFGVMYSLPEYHLTFDWLYGLLGPAIFIVAVGAATWFACRAALKQKPALLMRPKSPKAGSRVLIEKIPFIWNHLSFLNKVTARNLFRYKKRMIMTIAGILGCTALLMCAFAIKDSVSELMTKQYDGVYLYDLMVVAEDNDELIETMDSSDEVENYLSIRIDSVTVEYAGETVSIQLIVVPDEDAEELSKYIKLETKSGSAVIPGESGALVTINAGNILGFTTGDTITIRDLTLTQSEIEVSAIVMNYLGNNVYITQSVYESIFGEYSANGVLAELSDTCTDHIAFADSLLSREGITSATATEQLREEFSGAFVLINMVVYIIIVLAAALAFVVLFTLSTTNISERERELATIKVLGFTDREVHLYVNKETLILTVIGIIPGIIVGRWFGFGMTSVLNMPSLYFAVSIYPVSYFLSFGLALVFALIVQLITNRHLNSIDPATALKSVE